MLELLYLFGEPLLRALALDGVARRVGEEPARCLHGGGGTRHLGKNAVHFDVCRVSNGVLDTLDIQDVKERAELARKGMEDAEQLCQGTLTSFMNVCGTSYSLFT